MVAITHDMELLEAKLGYESQYVDTEQQAESSNELFELQKKRDSLDAYLKRASRATLAKWEQMRGPLGRSLDAVEAALDEMVDDIGDALSDKSARGDS